MNKLGLVLFAVQMASAAPIFQDNFESGSLSPARWATPGSAFVTNDPTGAANKVLSFASLGSGGDLFSVLMPNTLGTYSLDFDFYQAQLPLPNENIGYAETDHDTSLPGGPNELWVWNARDNGPITVRQWTHISLDITPVTSAPFTLKFEVAGSFPGRPVLFGVYFDNVTLNSVNAVPEPSTLWLAGFGVLGLLIRQRFVGTSR